MTELFTFANLATFLSLSGLEIILGIDNIIFIAIVVYGIEKTRRKRIAFFGVSLAIILRILMLFSVSWIMTLIQPLFFINGLAFTGRSILLVLGGGFLVFKSCKELREILQHKHEDATADKKATKAKTQFQIITQIIFVDLILSFDSVLVAVGMVNNLYLIIPAILISMVVMLFSAEKIGDFMHENSSIKVLGLGFVLLIGAALFLSGVNIEISKPALYFAFFFSLFIETINIRVRKVHRNASK
jgi:predicted tellurium resistance membrane protein TerC